MSAAERTALEREVQALREEVRALRETPEQKAAREQAEWEARQAASWVSIQRRAKEAAIGKIDRHLAPRVQKRDALRAERVECVRKRKALGDAEPADGHDAYAWRRDGESLDQRIREIDYGVAHAHGGVRLGRASDVGLVDLERSIAETESRRAELLAEIEALD